MASPSKMKREKKKERKVKRGNRNMEQNLRASLKRIETGSTDSRQKETTAVKEISTIVSGCIKEDPFKRPYTLLPPSPHPTPAYSSWSTYDILCGSGRVLPGEWKLVFVSRCLDDIVQLVFRLWKPPHNHPPLSPRCLPVNQPTKPTYQPHHLLNHTLLNGDFFFFSSPSLSSFPTECWYIAGFDSPFIYQTGRLLD